MRRFEHMKGALRDDGEREKNRNFQVSIKILEPKSRARCENKRVATQILPSFYLSSGYESHRRIQNEF